jgi:hypothetical protein
MNMVLFKQLRPVILGVLLSIGCAHAAPTNELPKLDDLLKLLREHGAMSQAELDRAATAGVLSSLQGQVVLVTNTLQTNLNTQASLSRSTNFDNGFFYFRIGEVKDDLSQQLGQKFQTMAARNKVKGVVLDLRYAGGTDYRAAGEVANLFVGNEEPLLSWGTESFKATAKTNVIEVPVAVLVNKQTGGAAEALAAVLRETQVALLIGSQTEGSASIFNEFALPNGQRARVAVAQVKVGKDKATPAQGLKPDILVNVSPDDERSYYEDAYKTFAKTTDSATGTNSLSAAKTNQPRLNEAELVRQHKEGFNARDQVADQPFKDLDVRTINDPALMRALDVLKGLAVVQQTRH